MLSDVALHQISSLHVGLHGGLLYHLFPHVALTFFLGQIWWLHQFYDCKGFTDGSNILRIWECLVDVLVKHSNRL
jgi:hypothetical protein